MTVLMVYNLSAVLQGNSGFGVSSNTGGGESSSGSGDGDKKQRRDLYEEFVEELVLRELDGLDD